MSARRRDILVVTPDLLNGVGGIARISRATALACHQVAQAEGGRLFVLALNDTGPPADDLYVRDASGYQGFGGNRFLLAGQTLRHAWRSELAVTIFCHVNLAVLGALFPPDRRRVAVIAHGIDVWERLGAGRRNALRTATEVWPVSRYTGDVVARLHGVAPERIRVIHNCLDPHWALEAPAGEASGERYCLLVSRMEVGDAYKGVETTLRAFARVAEALPGVRLHVVGQGRDRPRLMRLTQDLGMSKRIVFMGAVSDVVLRREYEACAFFVLPSSKEGFGLVYLEAMASSKAVLAAKATAVPEIVRHGESGELVTYGDLDALASAMRRLFTDPALAEGYGLRGRRILEDEFTFDRYQKAIARALRERFLG